MAGPQLRPLEFGEILDTAFTLYREHFGTFFLAALLPALPVAFVYGLVGLAMEPATTGQGSVIGMLGLLSWPYSLFVGVFVWGALVHGSSRALTGEPVSLGGAYGRALRRFLPLLGAAFVAVLLIWIGAILFIIPGILLAIVFFAVPQSVVIEDEGPLSALGRSRDLAREGWLRIFGIMLITWLIVSLPSMALYFGGGIAAALNPANAQTVAGGPLIAVMQMGGIVVSALTTPFMVSSLVVLYYDRRVRKEGLDLEVAAERMSPAGG